MRSLKDGASKYRDLEATGTLVDRTFFYLREFRYHLASLAENTVGITDVLEIVKTGFFVWKLLEEFTEVHSRLL